MSFAENINAICKQRGTTLTQLFKELGLSSNRTSAINKGSIPKEDIMVQLADKLHCNVADFFQSGYKHELDDDEQDIIRVFRSLSRKKKHEFMSTVYNFEKGKTT